MTTTIGVPDNKASESCLLLDLDDFCRSMAAITKLMVNLLHRVLKLAVQHITVGDNDHAVKYRVAVIFAQFHQVMGRPEMVLVLPEPALWSHR